MLYTGLVSVTFRKLPPHEIVALAAQAGMHGIEWGGDIHVPHGDIQKAREVRKMTADAGIRVAAYGSYYRVGCEDREGMPFARVLETAAELQAPTIRVWAGNRGSREADASWRELVARETCRIADMAAEFGITLSFEYHGQTLTDTSESACRLMRAIGRDDVYSYWQPPAGLDLEQQQEGLRAILPWLSNVHVFHWQDSQKLPLADGAANWRQYAKIFRTAETIRTTETIRMTESERYCLLEFVRDGDPQQFLADAATLRQILS